MSFLAVDKNGDVLKRILVEGTPGTSPANGQQVSVHYVGFLADTGEEFDTTKLFGDTDYSKPFTFRIGGGAVVQGFDVAVRSMKLHERCKVQIKSKLAYGSDGSPAKGMMPEIPPDTDLEFDLELVTIGKDESKMQAAKDRLEITRAEREAKAADRAAVEAEKAAARQKREEERAAKKAAKKGKKAAKQASAETELDKKAVKKMKPKELKANLKARGASIVGNKKELCARLLDLIEQ